jgi:hypothetical protein
MFEYRNYLSDINQIIHSSTEVARYVSLVDVVERRSQQLHRRRRVQYEAGGGTKPDLYHAFSRAFRAHKVDQLEHIA